MFCIFALKESPLKLIIVKTIIGAEAIRISAR